MTHFVLEGRGRDLWRFSLLVLAVAFTGLTVEIVLTRIFSVAFWYHYAFIAISVALLGWGTGALLVHGQQHGMGVDDLAKRIVSYASLFALSIPLVLLLFSRIPALPDLLPVFYLVASIPFFFGGACVSAVFRLMRENSAKLYFADLTGAASAGVVLEPSLMAVGAESAMLLAATLCAMSKATVAIQRACLR